MTTDDKIREEKVQYDAAKISALLSSKIDKYEFPTGEEILSSDQSRIIEQDKFTYSPLGKVFEKHTKRIEEQGRKQTEATEDHEEQLDLKPLMKKKNKVYHLINKMKHYISLLRKGLEKLKNYIIVLIDRSGT